MLTQVTGKKRRGRPPGAKKPDDAGAPDVGESAQTDTLPEPGPVSGLASNGMDASAAEDRKEKLILTLAEEGGLDLNSMRPATIDKARRAIELTPQLFPEKALPAFMLPDGMIYMLYSILGQVEVVIASRMFPPELAATMAYNQDDMRELLEPTRAVAGKYIPKALGKFKEELELIGALGKVHMQKIQNIQHEMYRRTQEESASRQGVA